MKKISLISIFLLLSSFSSCSMKEEIVYSFPTLFVIQKGGDSSLKVEDDVIVTPFNTYIQTSLYTYTNIFSKDELTSMMNDYQGKISYYHALSDRHYFYTLNDERIHNIKYLNEMYLKDEAISLDPYLYDLLKESYEFTINSDGKFNIFLGKINDIYENKINEIKNTKEDDESLSSLMDVTGLYFSSFSEQEKKEIEYYTSCLPSSSEIKNILSFNDENHEVTFHPLKDGNGNIRPIEISLGGCAKGYATQYYCETLKEKYNDICLIMNSGTSSIKATNKRGDDKDFVVRYINPAYQEQIDSYSSTYNDYEMTISLIGPFNISTSGYYENYFYELDGSFFVRFSHILDSKTGYSNSYFDQVSVYLNNSFLADMYSTALMNTNSIDEAKSLFYDLNKIYKEDNAQLILCKKEDENGNDYHMNLNHYSPLNDNEVIQGETKLNDKFKEAFYLSDNLYQNCSLISDKDLKYKENRICEIKKL